MEGSSASASLTTLSAQDADGSKEKGDICEYKIESEEQPFRISEKGELFALHPLNYSSSHSYVLSVLATDCSGKTSTSPLLVVVEVRQRCGREWNGACHTNGRRETKRSLITMIHSHMQACPPW